MKPDITISCLLSLIILSASLACKASVKSADTISVGHLSAWVDVPDSILAKTTDISSRTITDASPFKIGVKTNMLYDLALIPNIGIEVMPYRNIVVEANWIYARWDNRSRRRYWRIYGGDVSLSRQFSGKAAPSLSRRGHRLGVYASLACYDFQFGFRHPGALSDKFNYSAGLTYTFSLPLSRRLNLGFSLSAGYAWGTYKKHTPIDDHDVWLSTHRLRYWGPTKAAVSLVWVIDIPRHKHRKEAADET